MVKIVAASNTIRAQNLGPASTTSGSTIPLLAITPPEDITGTIRVTFDITSEDCYETVDSCTDSSIYKNNVNITPSPGFIRSYAPPSPPPRTYSTDIPSVTLLITDTLWLEGSYSDIWTGSTWANFYLKYDPIAGAYFTSTPSGARIWVDGVDRGVATPNAITGLAAGSHTYKLTLAGYQDATGSFSISGTNTTNVNVTLTPVATGSASFSSVPSGATIWIDGTSTGATTPNTIANLSAGSHNYTLKLTGYYDASGSFSVTGGSTTTVPAVTFAPSLYITSTPSGASIYIDTVLQGVTTPSTITNLSVGFHTYKLVLVGYNVLSGNFTATGGQTTNVSNILSGTATAFLTAGD